MKPQIGISTSRNGAAIYARDSLKVAYADAVVQAGGLAVPLPNLDSSIELLDHLDGLLLTGGGDFDPSLFGQADRGTDWQGYSPQRDRTELQLIARAGQLGMPMLGICRGTQALAVAFGGTLLQDIPRARPDSIIRHGHNQPRRMSAHTVQVEPQTRLGSIVGREVLTVNSFHHQAVDRIPLDWVVAARAPDGVIEAIERADGRFWQIGVQWHPEDLVANDAAAQALFVSFVTACRNFGGIRHGRNRD